MASLIRPDYDTSFSQIVERLLESMGSRLDANPGSIARTMAEAYAREMAMFYEMLELAHSSGYLETAKGGALDNVVAMLGIRRERAGRLTGHVEFSRSTAAPSDIGIPAGFQVTGADEAEDIPTFATTTDAILARGETRVVVQVQELDYDPKATGAISILNPGKLTVMPRPLLGIEAVTNSVPLRRSTDDESDEDLRNRAHVTLREGEGGTLEAIAASVRKEGVRQVTVREPESGPPGIIEVVIGDADVANDPAAVRRVEQAVRESKAAGVRATLLYAKTVHFQPRFEVEPVESTLDDAGFDRLRRSLEEEVTKFGARQPVGEMIRRRRLEAALFGHPGVRNVGNIRMRTFVNGLDAAGKPGLVLELEDRERGAQGDWYLRPLETAVFDVEVKPPEITRMRPPTYRFSFIVRLAKEDLRSTDDVRKAVREALDAYVGWLARNHTTMVARKDLETTLQEKARILELLSVIISEGTGLSTELAVAGQYPLAENARLEPGSVEVVRNA